jgi:preprotein translocase subunit YajC
MTLYRLNVLLAQQQVMQQDPRAAKIMMFGYLALFFVIMWFMMIAPQRKKAKEQDLMLKALRAGDKIVTSSGIVGVILSIKDKSLSIRSADTKLEILKSAVSEVTERGGESSEIKS